jgi:hypothetical protein
MASSPLSGKTEWVFLLPLPENLANARLHWRAKDEARQAYFAACDALQARGDVPAPPPVAFPKVRVGVEMIVGGAMDEDNSVARTKWCWDWLKTRGYIANVLVIDNRIVAHPKVVAALVNAFPPLP